MLFGFALRVQILFVFTLYVQVPFVATVFVSPITLFSFHYPSTSLHYENRRARFE